MNFDQEIRYRLLKILSRKANFSQREMAREMGISLGKVNFCLSELARKGLIKIAKFKDSRNKLQYLYKLTPSGLEAKAGLTISFLKRKVSEYNEIKSQIRELAQEANVDNPLEAERQEALEETGQTL